MERDRYDYHVKICLVDQLLFPLFEHLTENFVDVVLNLMIV